MNGEDLLRIVRPAETGAGGFTLSALMHDEIYFLPAFLAHYRALGVAHFVLLDDCSTDGARELAAAQPDVTLLASPYRYGDTIPDADGRPEKAKMLWRRAMLDRWGSGRWSLHLDLDEFIDLPAGMGFPDLAARLDRDGYDTVYGAMVDLYPESLAELASMSDSLETDLARNWYFDAVPHVVPLPFGPPLEVYGGTRGRLARRHGIATRPPAPGRRLTNLIWGNSAPFLHRLRKAVLLKWSAGRVLRNEHSISPARVARIVLPIRHYKFTPSLADKVEFALASGAYTKNSGQYRLIDRLLAAMAAQGGSFLGETSRVYAGFEGFRAAGIARGL